MFKDQLVPTEFVPITEANEQIYSVLSQSGRKKVNYVFKPQKQTDKPNTHTEGTQTKNYGGQPQKQIGETAMDYCGEGNEKMNGGCGGNDEPKIGNQNVKKNRMQNKPSYNELRGVQRFNNIKAEKDISKNEQADNNLISRLQKGQRKGWKKVLEKIDNFQEAYNKIRNKKSQKQQKLTVQESRGQNIRQEFILNKPKSEIKPQSQWKSKLNTEEESLKRKQNTQNKLKYEDRNIHFNNQSINKRKAQDNVEIIQHSQGKVNNKRLQSTFNPKNSNQKEVIQQNSHRIGKNYKKYVNPFHPKEIMNDNQQNEIDYDQLINALNKRNKKNNVNEDFNIIQPKIERRVKVPHQNLQKITNQNHNTIQNKDQGSSTRRNLIKQDKQDKNSKREKSQKNQEQQKQSQIYIKENINSFYKQKHDAFTMPEIAIPSWVSKLKNKAESFLKNIRKNEQIQKQQTDMEKNDQNRSDLKYNQINQQDKNQQQQFQKRSLRKQELQSPKNKNHMKKVNFNTQEQNDVVDFYFQQDQKNKKQQVKERRIYKTGNISPNQIAFQNNMPQNYNKNVSQNNNSSNKQISERNIDDQQKNTLNNEITDKQKQLIFEVFKAIKLLPQNCQNLDYCNNFDNALKQVEKNINSFKSNRKWQQIIHYFNSQTPTVQSIESFRATLRQTMRNTYKRNRKSMANSLHLHKEYDSLNLKELISKKQQTQTKIHQLQLKFNQGVGFKKYCFREEKIQDVLLYFSYDFKLISLWKQNRDQNGWKRYIKNCWKSDEEDMIQIFSLQNFKNIINGAKSKNFMSYILKNYPIDEETVFSLVFQNRSLDLMSKSKEQKQEFLEMFKFILEII